jgi:hypothetical protein
MTLLNSCSLDMFWKGNLSILKHVRNTAPSPEVFSITKSFFPRETVTMRKHDYTGYAGSGRIRHPIPRKM